ncbi:MAG: thioredoxin-dependent thiol peroxidase [Actinobacteria bacterium]|nr:thioredoxin-dependent thiol peroxidase [Actinomycetota bacterium]
MTDRVVFSLSNQDGETVTDKDFAGSKYVMFFYPRAMTPGCTVESCDFRDSYDQFAEAGYRIVGVSPDPPSRNRKFREKEDLNFDLLSDEDLELAKSLGAWGEKSLYGKLSLGLLRSTFVVDTDGKLIKAYRSVKATGHVARVKADLLGA